MAGQQRRAAFEECSAAKSSACACTKIAVQPLECYGDTPYQLTNTLFYLGCLLMMRAALLRSRMKLKLDPSGSDNRESCQLLFRVTSGSGHNEVHWMD